jgi:hypothetical protein
MQYILIFDGGCSELSGWMFFDNLEDAKKEAEELTDGDTSWEIREVGPIILEHKEEDD